MDFREDEWNKSYKNKDNFVFYPHEEIIRFVSKYIRKKKSLEEFEKFSNMNRCLDLGCGIGRHVIFLDDMGFEVYGIDLSYEAIKYAENWCDKLNKCKLKDRLLVGSAVSMPYKSNFFDFIVSHGVIDSMSFDIAKKTIEEVHRVIRKGGLFYFDVISGCDYEHYREYDGEEIVNSKHEYGTIQSYFNWNKINLLIENKFKIKECVLIQRESVVSKLKDSRYHIIVEKL